MVLTVAGSGVLAVMQLSVMLMLSRKTRAGWLLSVATSLVAMPYDVLTAQYGFIAVDVVALVIAARGYSRWRD